MADGERVVQLGTLTQRWTLDREGRMPVDVEVEAPRSTPWDALPFDGKLRVLEYEGELWTAEDDTRFPLVTSTRHHWLSLARSGPYLVCAGTESDESFNWSWLVFQVLESDGLGGLRTVAYTALEHVPARWPDRALAADRLGGLYWCERDGAYGGRLEEDGTVTMMADLLSLNTFDAVASPQFDLVYFAPNPRGIRVHRVLEPGVTEEVMGGADGETVLDIAVWADTTRRIDRVAAASQESLFIFEVDAEGSMTPLVTEEVEGWTVRTRLAFLDSGTLVSASGGLMISLRPAWDLSRERVFEVPQHSLLDDFVPEAGRALTVAMLRSHSLASSLSEHTRHSSGAYLPRSSLVIPWTHSMAIHDDFVYARTSGNGVNHRIHIIKRAAEPRLALIDSFEVTGRTSPDLMIAGEFLLADHEVFDLTDPRHPVLIDELSQDSYRQKARPHPTVPDAQLIASSLIEWGHPDYDSLYLWRLSPAEGLVREWNASTTELALFIEFDDQRDLLYTGGHEIVSVYDISEPSATHLLHDFMYNEERNRFISGFGAAGGMLHIGDEHAGDGQLDTRLRPWWWNDETIVPVGPSLRHSLEAHELYGDSGRLIFSYIAGAELRYTRPDPHPLGTDAACSGPPPFGPR